MSEFTSESDSESDYKHIIHCISQLKRFNKYFMKGDMSRILQFGYNLGRLQELSIKYFTSNNPNESYKHSFPCDLNHIIFWQPIEKYIVNNEFQLLDTYIDYLKTNLHLEYDMELISK